MRALKVARCVLLGALLLGSSAFAQAEASSPPTPPAAMKLIELPSRTTRLFVLIGGGLAGATAGAIVGGGVGCSTESILSPNRGPTCGPASLVLAGSLALTGIGLGTWVSGDAMGLQGHPAGVVVGMMLGILSMLPAGFITAALLSGGYRTPPLYLAGLLGAFGTGLLPFAGAALGYELTRPEKSSETVSLAPLISVRSDGAIAGVSLRF